LTSACEASHNAVLGATTLDHRPSTSDRVGPSHYRLSTGNRERCLSVPSCSFDLGPSTGRAGFLCGCPGKPTSCWLSAASFDLRPSAFNPSAGRVCRLPPVCSLSTWLLLRSWLSFFALGRSRHLSSFARPRLSLSGGSAPLPPTTRRSAPPVPTLTAAQPRLARTPTVLGRDRRGDSGRGVRTPATTSTVMSSERSAHAVIPSERSESRDPGAPGARPAPSGPPPNAPRLLVASLLEVTPGRRVHPNNGRGQAPPLPKPPPVPSSPLHSSPPHLRVGGNACPRAAEPCAPRPDLMGDGRTEGGTSWRRDERAGLHVRRAWGLGGQSSRGRGRGASGPDSREYERVPSQIKGAG
jgi:hypothetical protein